MASDAVPPETITPETVAAGEALLGVRFSAAQRDLLAPTLAPQIALAQARRALVFPETLAPACRFDPRLPGWSPPIQPPFAPEEAAPIPLPSDAEDIAFAPLTALGGWIRSRQISSTELTELYLARIARLAPALACIPTVTAERARAEAAEADRLLAAGTWLGPLHGIPWGAKDLLDTAGIATSWGAEPFADRVPAEDAAIVRRLKAAGAVLVAKTAVGALAYGDEWSGGKCRNPWNPEEGSTGSSAGSASALAAGLMSFTIGTETGGSIIAPAMRCGNTALRPSFGRVSRIGAMPLAWSLDKIGPMARRVEDLALLLHVLNGFDAADPGSIDLPFGYDARRPVAGLRLGYFPQDFDDPEIVPLDRATLDTARAIGLELVPLDRPDLPYLSLRSVLFAEAAAAFEALTLSGRDALLRRQDAEAWPNEFRKARFLSAVDLVQLDRFRRQVMGVMAACFAAVDAIIGPSMVGPMLTITNFTGHPSLVLRTGFIDSPTRSSARTPPGQAAPAPAGPMHSVPHGISLWGRLFDEGTILNIGRALEHRLAVWDRRPPLPAAEQQ
jgi:Asp-tRNA(Asn)/Glu-tRNA(Gln) amidotransferase A subunit family amidase